MMSLSEYLQMMREAVEGRLPLSEFSKNYMAKFSAETNHFPEPIFEILNDLFLDSDEFEPDRSVYESLKREHSNFVIDGNEYAIRIAVAFKNLSGHDLR
jgi:hypothetical protein